MSKKSTLIIQLIACTAKRNSSRSMEGAGMTTDNVADFFGGDTYINNVTHTQSQMLELPSTTKTGGHKRFSFPSLSPDITVLIFDFTRVAQSQAVFCFLQQFINPGKLDL